MKFFQPQLQLVRDRKLDQPDVYYLHAVTFCPRTCYAADGYTVSDELLQTEGVYQVFLNLWQDPDVPDFESITPIVHTIDLGPIPFPEGEGWIDVEVRGLVYYLPEADERGETKGLKSKTKTGGKGTVSTTHAVEKVRPSSEDFL